MAKLKRRRYGRQLLKASMVILVAAVAATLIITHRRRSSGIEGEKLIAICYYSKDASSGGAEMQIIAADIVQYLARVTRPPISEAEIGGGLLDKEKPPEAYSYIVIKGPASGGRGCKILVIPENRTIVLEADSYMKLRSTTDRLVLALCRPYILKVSRYEKSPSGWVLLMILPGTSDIYAGMWLSGSTIEEVERSVTVIRADGVPIEDYEVARILLGDRYIG